jgi:guanylate kinase
LEVLRRRLEDRATDAPATIAKRLEVAQEELAARSEFQHVIVNDQLDAAVDALEEIYLRACPPTAPSR